MSGPSSPAAVSAAALDAVIEGDRRFFERHRDRSHRIRHLSLAEDEELRHLGYPLDRPESGCRWFVAVRQVEPGVRVRLSLQGPAAAETDVPESLAAALFELVEAGVAVRVMIGHGP